MSLAQLWPQLVIVTVDVVLVVLSLLVAVDHIIFICDDVVLLECIKVVCQAVTTYLTPAIISGKQSQFLQFV